MISSGKSITTSAKSAANGATFVIIGGIGDISMSYGPVKQYERFTTCTGGPETMSHPQIMTMAAADGSHLFHNLAKKLRKQFARDGKLHGALTLRNSHLNVRIAAPETVELFSDKSG
jgi:hypothetical protein